VYGRNFSHPMSLTEQSIGNLLNSLAGLDAFDLTFLLTAITFNLLVAGIFIAQKKGWPKLIRIFGILWLSLGFPLAVVFIHYLTVGRDLWVLVYFGFIFLYILAELLLDYVFKIEFRQKWITHAPYIILEYIALFGLIGISFSIDWTWGFLVSSSFWILLGSLIYLYSGRNKETSQKTERV
jgi:hypothetical protein